MIRARFSSFCLALGLTLASASSLAQPADPPDPAAPSAPAVPSASAGAPVAPAPLPSAAPSAPSASAAPAAARPLPAVPRDAPRQRAPQWGVGVRLGPHYTWVRSEGLDPIASADLVLGFFTDLQLRVWKQGPFSAWALAGWSVGGAGSAAPSRGVSSSLLSHDLHAGIEGQFQLFSWLTPTVRLAPGARYLRVTTAMPDLDHNLVSRGWTYSADLAAGLALRFASIGDDQWPSARFWFHPEVGYTLAGSVPTRLEADVDDDEKGRYGAVSLPALSPSGVQLRVAFGVTFLPRRPR